MNRSFYNGVSGIKTHQFGIDTWANNIANENGYGFKESIPEFQTQFSQVLSGVSNSISSDVGLGSSIQATSTDLSQGELINSDREFDTAIKGNGWYGFMHKNSKYYTKVGAFYKDSNGDLVNEQGEYLLGSMNTTLQPISLSKAQLNSFGKQYENDSLKDIKAFTIETNKNNLLKDSNTNVTTNKDIPLGNVDTQNKINLPTFMYIPPKPTKNIKFGANLNIDVKSKIDKKTGKEIAKSSDHFTTSLFNADGDKNILDMTFTKQFPEIKEGSIWNAKFNILKDIGEKKAGISYDPKQYITYPNDNTLYKIIDSAVGSLKFDGSGALIKANIPTLSNEGTSVTLNLGTPLDDKTSNSGYDGITTIKGLGSEAKYVENDGKSDGLLKDYSINGNGDIIANFTNGETASIAKIAIFHFQNDEGLKKISGNMFAQSSNSGKAFFYTDKSGKTINGSTILSNKLETSNVNLARALTELIVMQKAFDASAKSITTSDQMIQKAINMKR